MKFDLIFEGGGVKGIAYVGALQALSDQGHTHGRLIGTSVGALFATLLAAGYTPTEFANRFFDPETRQLTVMQEVMRQPRVLTTEQLRNGAILQVLRSIDLPGIPDRLEERAAHLLVDYAARYSAFLQLLLFLEQGGIYDDAPFLAWLQEALDEKTPPTSTQPFSTMTLKQFHEATSVSLTLIAADITGSTMLILNHHTAPNCPLLYAVRMAVSIPPILTPVIWQAGWGRYGDDRLEGHQVVDGSLLSNFPIELFLSREPAVVAVMGQPAEGAQALGLLLDDLLMVPGLPVKLLALRQQRLAAVPGLILLYQMFTATIEARGKSLIRMYPWHVVHLPAQGIDWIAVEISERVWQLLRTAGYNAMVRYLTAGGLARALDIRDIVQQAADARAVNIITVHGNISGTGIAVGTGAQARASVRDADRE